MAVSTIDYWITPADGWVKVATDPKYLQVKPGFFNPWAIALTTSGAPSAATAATGKFNFSGQPNNGGTLTLGDITYTWVTAYNNPGPYDIKIGTNQAASEAALTAAINGRSAIPATAATGSVIFAGLPTATQTVLIGSETYTFVASRSAPFEVTIGADATATGDNLVTALTADSTLVSGVNTTGTVALTALMAGYAGNSITLSTAATNTTVSGPNLTGGNDIGPAIAASAVATAVDGSGEVDLTTIAKGYSSNSITLSENSSNMTITALSGGADAIVGLVFGKDQYRAFEAFEYGDIAAASAPSGEFYVNVTQAPNGGPNGVVRFGVMTVT